MNEARQINISSFFYKASNKLHFRKHVVWIDNHSSLSGMLTKITNYKRGLPLPLVIRMFWYFQYLLITIAVLHNITFIRNLIRYITIWYSVDIFRLNSKYQLLRHFIIHSWFKSLENHGFHSTKNCHPVMIRYTKEI